MESAINQKTILITLRASFDTGWVLFPNEVKDFSLPKNNELAKMAKAAVNDYKKALINGKPNKEPILYLVYVNNWRDRNGRYGMPKESYLYRSDILKYATICKVTNLQENNDNIAFTLEGIKRIKWINLLEKDGRNVKDDNANVFSNEFYELQYDDATYSDVSLSANTLFDDKIQENFQLFDEAISELVSKNIYPEILDRLIDVKKLGLTKVDWLYLLNESVRSFQAKMQDITERDIPDLSNFDESLIVSTFALHAVLDNFERYCVLEKPAIIDQIDYIMDLIAEFPHIKQWTTKQKEIFNNLEFFKKRPKTKSKFYDEKLMQEQVKILTNRRIPEDENLKEKETKIKNDQKIDDNFVEGVINKKVKDNLDKQQKEFLLREKMKAIKEALNEANPVSADDDEFDKILKDKKLSKMFPQSVVKIIASENERLKSMMQGTPDANITQAYIKTLKELPWRKVEIETLDIKKAREILDKNHYGLKEVKERIIEYLALIINHKNIVKNQKDSKNALINIDKETQIDMSLFKEDQKSKKTQKVFNNVPILTLVGPPGTGKTSLARAIAEALNKSYIKISLGGVHDESEIRGHRKTYVGSMPGKIIKAIQRANVSNPLILLDEIDKMSSDYKGDPSSAMLEVLDPEQNTKFQDNYLEHEYDLSKVMFIATANYYENIPKPLLDRVEIIELSSYTLTEKIRIAREHLIETVIKQSGLKNDQFIIDNSVIEFIIKHYTAEAGVRGLKRLLDKMARKIVTKIVSGEKIDTYEITQEKAIEFLGVPKFTEEEDDKKPQVGVVNGLAYTSVGGTTLQIEVTTFPSKNGGIKLTGSLKDVMKESANIALTFVRSHAKQFGIDFNFEENEIHIHVPEGAVPKDGPSAGVTFTTALISALSNKAVPQDVAMTGEITLRGRVLEIGGLKEKSFAAFKKGVKRVFIPYANKKNIKDIPDEVKEGLTFIPVKEYYEIYDQIFGKK